MPVPVRAMSGVDESDVRLSVPATVRISEPGRLNGPEFLPFPPSSNTNDPPGASSTNRPAFSNRPVPLPSPLMRPPPVARTMPPGSLRSTLPAYSARLDGIATTPVLRTVTSARPEKLLPVAALSSRPVLVNWPPPLRRNDVPTIWKPVPFTASVAPAGPAKRLRPDIPTVPCGLPLIVPSTVIR